MQDNNIKKLTCILCPCGCALEVDMDSVTVTGNSCPKGARYGINEVFHPVRTVTSAVFVANRQNTTVSVKTSQPVPKERIFDVMKIIRALRVEAPVSAGDVIMTDVFGADIIATQSVN